MALIPIVTFLGITRVETRIKGEIGTRELKGERERLAKRKGEKKEPREG